MPKHQTLAPLAELVDARDSKSRSLRSAGSIPAGGTIGLFLCNKIIDLTENSPTFRRHIQKVGHFCSSFDPDLCDAWTVQPTFDAL